ncbi:alpha-mannosidase [candidate division KSB1 bacterium]|nr:alpha-mannosidase [candidate division KSB1 bacterium]
MTVRGMSALVILFIITQFCTAEIPPQDITVHLVGNAHIDLAYRWRWNETVDRVGPDTFEGVLHMMEIEPDLTFAQSQLALYEVIQANHPAMFGAIRRKIESGHWALVGGQWSEPDAILAGGESYIRQFLVGMEYAERHLGVKKVEIAWVPDSFCGQANTLPQIYSGCGIKYYVFGRGAPEGKRIFRWSGPDGSNVLAYKVPRHYNLRVDRELVQIVSEWCKVTGYPHAMVLYGEGDHGGGPREPDIQNVRELQSEKDFPALVYNTPEKYFAELDRSGRQWPEYSGEIGLGTGEAGDLQGSWRGSYTSQARVKKANRDMENLLLTAEKFATIGAMLQRKPLYPRVDFREAWKIVLRNQFHDILPGTSIGDVFDDVMQDYAHVKNEGERLLMFGLETIGSRVDTRGEGRPVVVYNPLSWTRTDVVQAAVRFVVGPEELNVQDYAGANIPFQVDGWSEDGLTAYISFLAQDIPPLGFKLYRILNQKPPQIRTDLKLGPDYLVNEYFNIRWDAAGLTYIYDKRLDKNIITATANIPQLLGESRSSSWDLFLSGERLPVSKWGEPGVLANGPVSCVLVWQDYTHDSFITRELILKAGVPRVEFRMTVDWHDHDKLLQIVFPVNVNNGRAFYEQPYGVIERPADGADWPAQNWIDLSSDSMGVALLNNGKYGFDISDRTMRMSVVRGARDMDPRMDEGVHVFDYALYSHAGDWRHGLVTRQALELNHRLIAVQENQHIGNLPDWGTGRKNEFSLPPEHSFFSTSCDNVVISAVKVQQGDWSPANVVLRLFEAHGKDSRVTVHLPALLKKIVETNHLEQPFNEQKKIETGEKSFTVNIGRFEIKTFLITF